MKIYFAGAIRAGRDLQPLYEKIINYIHHIGYDVLTTHVASSNVMSDENAHSMQVIYERDIRWMKECNLLIADVTIPSLGVGYEIAYALHLLKKKVFCIYNINVNLSAMIKGNTSSNLQIASYSQDDEAIMLIEKYLHNYKEIL